MAEDGENWGLKLYSLHTVDTSEIQQSQVLVAMGF